MSDKKIKIEPKDPAITICHIVHDQYVRDFRGEKWPCDATIEEWKNYLRPTGLFREAKKPKEGGFYNPPLTADKNVRPPSKE